MANKFTIDEDFVFAKEENWRQAPTLRYVAAINPELTKKEFVAAAVRNGYLASTAAIQFAQSRKFSLTFGDVELLPSGILMEKTCTA